MEPPLSPAVVEALSSLTEAQQLEVIAEAKKRKPELTPEQKREAMQAIAGSLSKEAAAEMRAAIDEGCRQINHASWE